MVINRDRTNNWNYAKFRKDVKPLYEVKLEHVLGLTVTSNSALDCDSKTGIIAYPAGCTIVFLSPFREKQSHLLNDSRKSVTCLTYSPDGRYLATGEYGHQPSIRIWDLSDNSKCCEFTDHKCGINCLAFSPNQRYLVSVGSQHDMIINVWDWRSRIKIGANKVSTKIKAVAFCQTGDYFVTVGNRHVKFWYIQHSKQSVSKDQPGLIGRAAILGEQQNNDFVDVVCGKGNYLDMTYVITRAGILCEFNGRRLLDRWVNVKTSCAFCITAGEEYLFIGCAESIIRCFNIASLAFVTTLPRTHYLGVDVAKALNITHTANHPKDAKYPDTIAVVYDESHKKLTCVYNDHSLYIWDIHDIKKVGKANSYLYHCACIWGVETYPNVENSVVPPGSFITCSSDDTIRFWNLDKNKSSFSTESAYQSNIYSNELTKIIYIDPDNLQYIKNTDIGLTDKAENSSYDDRNGVRSMGISNDGQQLATGDRSGNIRVYGLKNVQEVCKIEAHDAEILCLEYTPAIPNSNKRLLLSASRDRLIHVFDASDYYKFVETLDDHSSSITAVRFIDVNGQLQLVSCSADKSIIFRRYQNGKNGHFVRDRLLAGKSTLYDMAVDCSQKYILTACQDRYIRVYNVHNGKQCKNFKGSVGEDGSVIKVTLDNSGRYLATSCTDKTLCIFDYYSGECIASMCGHSELVTGLRFSNDCERLVSASGDGCIFIWRLPRDMVVTMQTRIAQQRARFSSSKSVYENSEDQMNEMIISSHSKKEINQNLGNDMRFNDGQLPLWVTKSVNDESSFISESNTRKMMPKGRWAQRLTPFAQDGILHLPSSRDSDGSKEDSSVDSGTETSRPEDRHEKLIVPQKMVRTPPKFITVDDTSDRLDLDNTDKVMFRQSNSSNVSDVQDLLRTRQHTDDSSLGSFKNEDLESTEHDGDIEDYSEVESAENESNNKVMYYQTVDDALSEFKVNAIDADELRKSQRKIKRNALAKKNPTLDITSFSVSGSQESDDDDDVEGGSTPSADNSEKANSLTISSVDVFIQREKYLKGTYESLSGAEIDIKPSSDYHDKKLTISSQHHSLNTDCRNQKIIQATIQTKKDLEANTKRQELQSRLEDIRGKLECAGHSSLKSSQSTMDLRRNETYFVPVSVHKNSDYQGIKTSFHRNNAKTVCINDENHCEFTNETYFLPLRSSNPSTNNLNFKRYCNSNNSNDTNPANDFQRPNVLNINSYANVQHNQLHKNVNLSLPHSPVCEKEFSSIGCKLEKNKKLYSCSFYIDINNEANRIRTVPSAAELPDDDRDYSSDSLDEEDDNEFESLKTRRRRCVSEYQLSWKDSDTYKNVEQELMRSYWNSSLTDINRSHSEENILNDDADSLQDNSDRYSSASFFLRKRKQFDSSESILTDESEYQFLFSNKEVFRSTESILTDASDSNLNSVSDDMNPNEETTLALVSKTPVMRTRSLQDTCGPVSGGGQLTRHFFAQKEVNQNRSCEVLDGLHAKYESKKPESFFIPMESSSTAKTPDDIKELIMKKITKKKNYSKSNCDLKSLDHPLVTHKPPKPLVRSPSGCTSGNKTYRKKVIPKDEKMTCKVENKYLGRKIHANVLENIDDKIKLPEKLNTGTFTKTKSNLGKNLLRSPVTRKMCNTTAKLNNEKNEKSNNRIIEKSSKNEKLKRAVTITKYDIDLINQKISEKLVNDRNPCESFQNYFEVSKCKRLSLPITFVSLNRLSDCFSSLSNYSEVGDDGDVGMRRSCSLSDLSPSSMFLPAGSQRKYAEKYPTLKHPDSVLHASPISRSSSEIALMPPPSHHRRSSRTDPNSVSQRIMRPTISSQNKIKSSASFTKINSTSMRRRPTGSLSYMTLNDVSNLEDSSSEDNKSDRRLSTAFLEKQFAGKRFNKFLERSCSERDLSALNYPSNKKRNQQINEAKSEAQLFCNNLADVSNAPLSRDLLNTVVDQFKKTADNIIRIHDRIAVENINDAEKKMLLLSLRNTIGQVQSNLRSKIETSDAQHENNSNNTKKNTNNDTSLPNNDNVVSMIQQYSDVLVSIVQRKFDQKPA